MQQPEKGNLSQKHLGIRKRWCWKSMERQHMGRAGSLIQELEEGGKGRQVGKALNDSLFGSLFCYVRS